MTTKYFKRDGHQCGVAEWKSLRKRQDYAVVRQYSNGQVYVAVEWLGEVPDTSIFRDYWPLYRLRVCNYNDRGVLCSDPVENGKTFPNESVAIQAYEAFLERWSASHRDEHGEFVEEDNDLKEPEPESPDKPATESSFIKGLPEDDVGAW